MRNNNNNRRRQRIAAIALLVAMAFTSLFALPLAETATGAAAGINAYAVDTADTPAVGDTVYFGRYPQSLLGTTRPTTGTEGVDWVSQTVSLNSTGYTTSFGDPANGATAYYKIEPIAWRVLSAPSGKLFLMAEKALDAKPYHIDSESVTWATSTIRSWLNGYGASYNTGGSSGTSYTSDNFIGKAFTAGEKDAVSTTSLTNPDNPSYGTAGGMGTNDKVFLLSYQEAINSSYGFNSSYDTARRAQTTPFARARYAYAYTDSSYFGNGYWWLRSPGSYSYYAAYVTYVGNASNNGTYVDYSISAVRPALNLNLTSIIFTSNTSGKWTAKASDTPSGDPTPLTGAEITCSPSTTPYTGSPITPAVTVKLAGTTLTQDTDYTLAFSNNTNPGTATVTATAAAGSSYSGAVSTTFTITKQSQSAPPAPTWNSRTQTSVTLNALSGAEYSRDLTNWQDSTVFTGLTPGTSYAFYQRMKETATQYASPASQALSIDMPAKNNQAAPPAPTLATKSATSVTLNAVSGAEYSMNGTSWQSSATFTGLSANTSYTFYQHYAETSTAYASPVSQGLTVTTSSQSTGGGDGTDTGGGSTPAVGDTVYFGRYPQSLIGTTRPSNGTEGRDWVEQVVNLPDSYTPAFGDPENGATAYYKVEPIAWRVLDNQGGKLFLMAEKALDAKPYHIDNENVTWETSTIRSWLNGYDASYNTGGNSGTSYTSDNFIGKAFTAGEKDAVSTTSLTNPDNPSYGTAGGMGTNDKVFLLSLPEIINTSYGFNSSYSNYDTARQAQTTPFARARFAWASTGSSYFGNGWWWLRSPGNDSHSAADVINHGYAYYYGYYVYNSNNAVRPALNLNLTSVIFTSNTSGKWTAKTSDTPTLIDPEVPSGGTGGGDGTDGGGTGGTDTGDGSGTSDGDGTGTGDGNTGSTGTGNTDGTGNGNIGGNASANTGGNTPNGNTPNGNTSTGQNPGGTPSATCSITFNANFGKLKMPKAYKKKWSAYFAPKPGAMTVTYGSRYGALPKAKKQPKGYSFAGWWTQPNGGAQVKANSMVGIDRNATLYAHWKIKVKFAAGRKSVSRAVPYGEKFGKLPPCKDRTGKFKFLGWYTKKAGGKKITAKQTVKITKPTTYYAHWRMK